MSEKEEQGTKTGHARTDGEDEREQRAERTPESRRSRGAAPPERPPHRIEAAAGPAIRGSGVRAGERGRRGGRPMIHQSRPAGKSKERGEHATLQQAWNGSGRGRVYIPARGWEGGREGVGERNLESWGETKQRKREMGREAEVRSRGGQRDGSAVSAERGGETAVAWKRAMNGVFGSVVVWSGLGLRHAACMTRQVFFVFFCFAK